MKVNVKLRCNPGFMKLMLSVLLFLFLQLFGQTVSGTVSDENGKTLQEFRLRLKERQAVLPPMRPENTPYTASSTATLVFSYVGYTTTEVAVSGRSEVNISLAVDSPKSDEVVVTALGITKQARGLGYSTTNVNRMNLP